VGITSWSDAGEVRPVGDDERSGPDPEHPAGRVPAEVAGKNEQVRVGRFGQQPSACGEVRQVRVVVVREGAAQGRCLPLPTRCRCIAAGQRHRKGRVGL